MQSVLISIRPQWCELIASGKKTIEVRKSRPKLAVPFRVYIYETGGEKHGLHRPFGTPFGYEGAQAIIGEFVCDRVTNLFADSRFWLDEKAVEQSCLTGDQIREYANGKELVYGWHISELQIYDKPRELSEFHKPEMPTGLRYENDTVIRPPQSWAYIEELEERWKTLN